MVSLDRIHCYIQLYRRSIGQVLHVVVLLGYLGDSECGCNTNDLFYVINHCFFTESRDLTLSISIRPIRMQCQTNRTRRSFQTISGSSYVQLIRADSHDLQCFLVYFVLPMPLLFVHYLQVVCCTNILE